MKIRQIFQGKARILILLSILIVGVLLLFINLPSHKNISKTPAEKPLSFVKNADLKEPVPVPAGIAPYELLAVERKESSVRIRIYTTEKDNIKLIALNDVLYPAFTESYIKPKPLPVPATPKDGTAPPTPPVQKDARREKALFIDYFDDKDTANGYFAKIKQPGITTAEKNRLFSHYTAVMVSNQQLGNQLVKQSELKVIKKY